MRLLVQLRAQSTFVAALSIMCFGVASCASLRAHASPDAPVAGMPMDATPIVFAPGIVSTGDVFASTFTPDGRTVIFTKFIAPSMTLMTSHYVNGAWSAPTALPFSGTYRDLDPSFSPDGNRLYFSSWRPSGQTPADTSNQSDTWYVNRAGDGWTSPMRLPEPVNSSDADFYPSTTRSGTLYLDSGRSRPSRRLVYRAAYRDGIYETPIALDSIINAGSGASNFFIEPDETYAVFAAERGAPDGRGGADLYIAWRTSNGWTKPLSLGDAINTEMVEFCPFVSRDGKYLFFTRTTPRNVTPVSRNIYVVRFDALRAQIARAAGITMK